MEALYEAFHAEAGKPLDQIRHRLEPFIMAHLHATATPILNRAWEAWTPPAAAKRVFVVIERRCHPNFELVLKNLAWAGPDLGLVIVCSDVNRPFVNALLGSKAATTTVLQAFKGEVSVEAGKAAYNTLLTSTDFYRTLPPTAEYMVTVQMDCFFRKCIPDDWFQGDYWGAPWAWKRDKPGGGGITVRRIAAMLKLCEQFRPFSCEPLDDNEDSWIADRVVETGRPFPPLEFRKQQVLESVPTLHPVAWHQFWTHGEFYKGLDRAKFCLIWRHLLMLDLTPNNAPGRAEESHPSDTPDSASPSSPAHCTA